MINDLDIGKIEYGNYTHGDNLALTLYTKEGEPYAVITVNLDGVLLPNMAYIDTNNCRWAEDFIKKYELGKPTGKYGESGFCRYPLYIMDFDKINEFNSK